jgi:membrane-associated phospholipid phosphatase
MTRAMRGRGLATWLLLSVAAHSAKGYAMPQEVSTGLSATATSTQPASTPVYLVASDPDRSADDFSAPRVEPSNSLGAPFLKNLLSDQKAIWTSPARLRWADGSWLFPVLAATAGFLATDRAVPPALSTNPIKLNRYSNFSNYGLYSMIGASGGLYVWGRVFTHDDRQRETGILAGEAALDSLGVATGLKYSFGRQRPNAGPDAGNFYQGGDSFPSDHSAIAWSIASVFAHEYPGPLTQIAAYGLATAISATRVTGKDHFPSDVFVGGAVGWLIGRQVYRAHHDATLGGTGVDSLGGNDEGEDRPDRARMGSAFVPLDSWVYAAFERLAALGYTSTQMMGLKPWTRIECGRLAEEAGESLQEFQENGASEEDAAKLAASLSREFSYEISLLGGGRNLTASLDSLYARAVSISGPPLTDSYHFGQTVAYDFGRPFERGTSAQAGGSFDAAAGPLAIYIRAEYQHAPAAPGPSTAVVQFISQADGGAAIGGTPIPLSEIPSGPVAAVNRPELLDAYAAVDLNNWQLVLGRQSLSWGPSYDSMMWSDNVVPVNMARLVNPESFVLPGYLRYFGSIRIDQFFGRLGGHPYVPRPFVYGQKFSIKPFRILELGFSRRTILGGAGSDSPLTAGNLFHSLFGISTGGVPGIASSASVPGDSDTEMDWTFYVPKTANYIVLYGDAFAEDDRLPIQNPARNPWNSGIYLTRFPGLPKLDLHVEGVSTEQAGLIPQLGGGNHGNFNYWNTSYKDGVTNYGNLLGNTVGRDGRSIHSWLTYWISGSSTVAFQYAHNTVSADFVPGGGAWQDYGVRGETRLAGGMYLKTEIQYERISRYPLLFRGPRQNLTAILEIGYSPIKKESNDAAE